MGSRCPILSYQGHRESSIEGRLQAGRVACEPQAFGVVVIGNVAPPLQVFSPPVLNLD